MTKGRNIKESILKEAFRLFLLKPYDKVTYDDLMASAGVSRGAILHHFPVKQELFNQVIDLYLFHNNSVFDFFNEKIGMSFISFIHIYCDWIESERRMFKELDIENFNRALVNITIQAFYLYPNMREKTEEFDEKEVDTWSYILKKGIESGELRKDIDIRFIARSIQNIYYGTSYAGLAKIEGIDTKLLKEQLLGIYNMIKY